MKSSNNQQSIDYLVRMILIGDSAVGKTSLILRFTEDLFTPSHIATIGIDFKIKTLQVDGKKVKLQIWDTAGQERFRTITTSYYKGAQGIILCYDCTNEQSFQNVINWSNQIDENAPAEIEKMLIATKCDKDNKVVTAAEGLKVAQEHGFSFYETSAMNGQNVNEAFMQIAKNIKDAQTLSEKKRGGTQASSNSRGGSDSRNTTLSQTSTTNGSNSQQAKKKNNCQCQ